MIPLELNILVREMQMWHLACAWASHLTSSHLTSVGFSFHLCKIKKKELEKVQSYFLAIKSLDYWIIVQLILMFLSSSTIGRNCFPSVLMSVLSMWFALVKEMSVNLTGVEALSGHGRLDLIHALRIHHEKSMPLTLYLRPRVKTYIADLNLT